MVEIEPGADGSSPSYLTALGNLLLFRAYETSSGSALRRTDGTGGGTFRLDIRPGADPYQALGGWAVVTTVDDGRGREFSLVNAADGTIVPLPEIQPGPAGTALFGNPTVAGNRLWASAYRADTGYELFTLDLTPFLTDPANTIFSNGFESGNTGAWSASVQ